jgi:hypothetical protein
MVAHGERSNTAAHPTTRPALRGPLRPVAPAFPPPPSGAAPVKSVPPPTSDRSILEQYRPAPSIVITHESVVEGDNAERLYEAYRANFEPLSQVSVFKQFDDHDEMLAQFADPRILKIVAWQAGVPVGLGMITNHLEVVPEIAPEFLRLRYPEHASRNAIYLGMYVLVDPSARSRTLVSRIYTELWQVPARDNGVIVYDVCDYNRKVLDTDTLHQTIAANFPRSTATVLDQQTWYVAELPEPIPDPRKR